MANPRIVQVDGFEVVYLDPSSNTIAAADETAQYGVSLSGGLGSDLGGERAVLRHGRENVFFWFSDVQKEDPDLYRFLWDLMRHWGGRLYYFTDGRKPEDGAHALRILRSYKSGEKLTLSVLRQLITVASGILPPSAISSHPTSFLPFALKNAPILPMNLVHSIHKLLTANCPNKRLYTI